jgi:hypothetical protein
MTRLMEAKSTAMKRLHYELPNYPGLEFSCLIEVMDRPRAIFKVLIQARGTIAYRRGWRRAFENWCLGYGRAPTGGNAFRQTLERSVTLVGYPVITAFIVEWVGLDWVDRALQDSEKPSPQPAAADLQALRSAFQPLAEAIDRIEKRASLTDYRLWAAARGILGLDLPQVDMTRSNWDHMLKPETEPQT